jgi:hypothetical protein
MTCAYVRAVKAGFGVAEVLGDLVERAALVQGSVVQVWRRS